MSMNLSAATARLRREIPAAEAALDDALIKTSSLMVTMLTARRTVGRAADGQQAIIRLARSQERIIEAQNDMLRVHSELVKVGEVYDIGDDGTCPEVLTPAGHDADVIAA